jgi:hypothetical protein
MALWELFSSRGSPFYAGPKQLISFSLRSCQPGLGMIVAADLAAQLLNGGH